MKQLVFYIFWGYCSFFCVHIHAQDGLQDKQLVVEKNRVLELSKANRLQNRMQKIELPPVTTEQVYELQKTSLVLPSLQINTSPFILPNPKIAVEKLPMNFIKGGFGNYTTLLGEAFLQAPTHDKYVLSLSANHLSSATGTILDEKSSANRTTITGQGAYKVTATTEIFGQVGYFRRGVNYYGYAPIVLKDWDTEKIKQTYTTLDFLVGYRANPTTKVTYQTELNYYNFSTKTGESENAFAVKGTTTRSLSDKGTLAIGLDASFASISTNTKQSGRNLLVVNPLYTLVFEKVSLTMGGTIVYDTDTLKETNALRLYPHLQLTYVGTKKMKLYACITGTTQRTSFRRFALENPFIGNQLAFTHTNKQWELTAGSEGRIAQLLGYHVKTSYAHYKNLYFFNNSLADSAKFAVLYDTEGTKLFSAMAEVYTQLQAIKLSLKSELFSYSTSTLTKAWHKPTFTTTVTCRYLYDSKLIVEAELFNQNGLEGYNFLQKKAYTLPAIFDTNVQVNYLFTPNISAFLKLNNIFSQQYQQYLYYTTQQFNVVAGAMWKF